MMEKVEQKQINTITDDNEVKRWSDLPNELLELIKKRLFYADQQNLLEVCKSWSSIEEKRLVPPLQQMPWLLVFDEADSGKLIDPTYKKTYQIDVKSMMKKIKISSVNRMPQLHKFKWDVNKMQIHESKYGWLLVSFTDPILHSNFSSMDQSIQSPAGTTFFLYSPFLDQDDNNNCIELPILSFNTTICMATFTSNPLDINACTVVTLNTTSDTIIINTYLRGQSSWNKLIFKCDQFPLSDVKRWMCTDECIFYYVLRDARVGTFDLAREEWHVFPPLPSTMREALQAVLIFGTYSRVMVYMVKSGRELFLISEWNLNRKNLHSSQWRYDVQYIYRLDLSSMIWEDLNNVGERVLFIGDGYRSVLKSNGELNGISNTLYNCSLSGLKYCTVHDYTVRNFEKGWFPQRHDCDIHYGSISRLSFVKILIDPPHLHQ